MTSSGTVAFNPTVLDYVIDAFERCNLTPQELESRHMFSARRSANFVLSRFANRGVNLFKVDQTPTVIPLIQGIPTYTLTPDVVGMLDTYVRLYQMGSPANFTPAFATVISSAVITVTQASNGLAVGNYVQVIIPVAIGGIVLSGYYLVTSVTGANTYTFNAATAALSTAAAGGTVPAFTTTSGSALVSVALTNHGYLSGASFQVQTYTQVGGIALQGAYTIASVTDANNFVITASNSATSGQTVSENGGQTQIAAQASGGAAPSDLILTPLSRNDYAAIPNKAQQGRPTTYWFNRQITPQVTVWPVTDQNGPYQLQTYLMRQIQDANPQGAQTMDLPYRFDFAFVSALAADLSIKFAPQIAPGLKIVSDEAWQEASDADREVVSFYAMPDFSGFGV